MLDQMLEQVRYLHYSIRTEQAYVHWCEPISGSGGCGTHGRRVCGVTYIFGIESPGLTSSLAIAEHVAAILSAGSGA